MGLIAELRRRNVLRMAALYIAAAWLVIEVAGALIDLSVLPASIGPWLAVLLVVGLPIALVVSWFFDVTPVGIVRDAESQEGQPTLATSGRRTDFVIIAMLAAAVVLLLIWEPPASGDEALTVLPFESMTGPDEASFSQGLSIELQSLLAQLRKFKVKQPPKEPILSRFSDIPTLAKEMDVRWVLQGSIRHSENRVRIEVHLLDAEDDAAIAWSNVFDRELNAKNLFNIQVEIARSITSELRLSLDESAEQRLAAPPTESMEAYAAYLLGRQRLKDRKVAELADAVEQFSLAIELDPQFANAYAGLADACSLYASYSGGQSSERCPASLSEREQLARNALELDPESAEAWISLGASLWSLAARMESEAQPKIHEKLQESIAAFERGLELNPTLPEVYLMYGSNLAWYHVYPDGPLGWVKAWRAGRWESVFDRGLEVDPLSILLHERKSWYPVYVRSKQEAKWHGHRMVEIAPDSPSGYETVGIQEWELNGRIDESIRWIGKAMEIDPRRPGLPLFIGLAYSALGDPDMALAYFDLASALTTPDHKPDQNSFLVDRTAVRFLSGKIDVHQVAELLPPLRVTDADSMRLAVYVDLTTGRPADALARMESFTPECIAASEIPVKYMNCPVELVRIYQELGDHELEQDLGDAILGRAQLLEDRSPVPMPWWQLDYVRTLATVGRTDEALDVLENLVSSGWRGDSFIKHLGFLLCCDVGFDSIRNHKRFGAIAATINADMAQQLENVREMQRRGEIPTLEEVNANIASAQDGG